MQIPNMILTTFLKRSSYKNSFEATFTRKKNQKKKKKPYKLFTDLEGRIYNDL